MLSTAYLTTYRGSPSYLFRIALLLKVHVFHRFPGSNGCYEGTVNWLREGPQQGFYEFDYIPGRGNGKRFI